MKTNNFKLINFALVVSLLFVITACTKEEAEPIVDQGNGELIKGDGVTAEEIGENQGEIGLLIDARDFAKRGYLPLEAIVKVGATEGDYSKTIPIDELTNLGRLSISVSSLSPAALAELKRGVSVEVEIKDINGTIKSEVFTSESFRENGTRLTLDAFDLPYLNRGIYINPNIPYYIQLIRNNTLTEKTFGYVELTSSTTGNIVKFGRLITNIFNSSDTRNQFYIIPVEGKEDTFYIKNALNGEYLKKVSIDFRLSEVANLNELTDLHEFGLEVLGSGNVNIKHINDYVYVNKDDQGTTSESLIFTGNSSLPKAIGEFRIVPATIAWEVESFSTNYMEPVLPKATTSFGFNSTVANCGSGGLSQEISISETFTTTTTVGWEESIELSSESSSTFTASVTASVSAEFFGIGGSAEASASQEYSASRSFTATNSGYQEAQNENSTTFEISRTVDILPGKAALIYDAYQRYSNIKIPFVQRFRIRGTDTSDGTKLLGNEIKTQFSFNSFNGVITKIGSDFIEVTIRGEAAMDELIQGKSEVKEVAYNCN